MEPIRQAVSELLADPERRRRLGEEGRVVAAETTWDAVAGRQIDLYRRAAGVA